MSKTMLRMQKNDKTRLANEKKRESNRNPDMWKSLPNPGMGMIGMQPNLLRASQEIKMIDSNLTTPERGNTPVGFDRIFNGQKSSIKKQDSSLSSPKAVDTLKKLRKEQYMATLTHNFSIMGASVDLKKPRKLR